MGCTASGHALMDDGGMNGTVMKGNLSKIGEEKKEKRMACGEEGEGDGDG